MADYGCWPLWNASPGEVGNINPADLPISPDLRHRLNAWAATYDRTLDEEYPPNSGFPSPESESAFKVEGRELAQALKEELGAEYKVVLHPRLA